MPDVLLTEDDGAVRVLRLNRPEKLNALDTELTQALHDALLAADRDPDVRAVVLAGNGRGFCAGADLSEFGQLTPDQPAAVLARADLTSRTQSLLPELSTPVVSVVQGAAVGGGAGLAIGADLTVVATDVKFGYPEMKHSIVPAVVMTGLQRHLGPKLAFELISLGRLLTAAEMLELGLANRVAEPGDVLAEGLAIAHRWAEASPLAMSTTKTLFHRVADLPRAEAMRAGRDVNVIMRGFRERV
ncbi:enoyl-CoA hydratase/isomerase family protein [Amycolatopsis jiangsuensis]|uniref:Enoyl-CoA hydratase/carnithine racemase n=1 Tax=Amycolatopsis jiangsuensis TaxID=1181879 RepID=A0A840IP24_9PSEU|nr:enoyl-CoA hydratase/isomerase family protein [Amycolatopsis jiangsuensis]MBB4684106.1 enoyl-CoA hydratase/carnithine racemase [Amycolatopsis jiangsuensis]